MSENEEIDDGGPEPVESYSAERVADLVELLLLHYEILFALTGYVENIIGIKASDEPLLSIVKALWEDDESPEPEQDHDRDARVVVLKHFICEHGKPLRGPKACSKCAPR